MTPYRGPVDRRRRRDRPRHPQRRRAAHRAARPVVPRSGRARRGTTCTSSSSIGSRPSRGPAPEVLRIGDASAPRLIQTAPARGPPEGDGAMTGPIRHLRLRQGRARAAVPLRLDPGTGRLDRSGAAEINSFDTYRGRGGPPAAGPAGGGEVVVVSLGPEQGRGEPPGGARHGRRPRRRGERPADRGLRPARHQPGSWPRPSRRERPDVVIVRCAVRRRRPGPSLDARSRNVCRPPVVSGVRTDRGRCGPPPRRTRQVVGGEQVVEVAAAVRRVARRLGEQRRAIPSFRDIVQAKKKTIVTHLARRSRRAADGGRHGRRETDGALGSPLRRPARTAGEVLEDGGTRRRLAGRFLSSKGLV